MAPFLNNTGFLLLVFHSWHTHTKIPYTGHRVEKHQHLPGGKLPALSPGRPNSQGGQAGVILRQHLGMPFWQQHCPVLLSKIHKLLHGKRFNFNLPMLIQFQCLGEGIYLAPNWTSSLNMANFHFGQLKGCHQHNQFFLACWIDVIFGVSIKGRLNIFGRMY